MSPAGRHRLESPGRDETRTHHSFQNFLQNALRLDYIDVKRMYSYHDLFRFEIVQGRLYQLC